MLKRKDILINTYHNHQSLLCHQRALGALQKLGQGICGPTKTQIHELNILSGDEWSHCVYSPGDPALAMDCSFSFVKYRNGLFSEPL